jgi:hypothetical protein
MPGGSQHGYDGLSQTRSESNKNIDMLPNLWVQSAKHVETYVSIKKL